MRNGAGAAWVDTRDAPLSGALKKIRLRGIGGMAHTHPTSERARDILARVMAAGGCLTVADWRSLGAAHGYQVRGLAGYFGGQWPSMVSDGDRRCLTDRGRERARGKVSP